MDNILIYTPIKEVDFVGLNDFYNLQVRCQTKKTGETEHNTNQYCIIFHEITKGQNFQDKHVIISKLSSDGRLHGQHTIVMQVLQNCQRVLIMNLKKGKRHGLSRHKLWTIKSNYIEEYEETRNDSLKLTVYVSFHCHPYTQGLNNLKNHQIGTGISIPQNELVYLKSFPLFHTGCYFEKVNGQVAKNFRSNAFQQTRQMWQSEPRIYFKEGKSMFVHRQRRLDERLPNDPDSSTVIQFIRNPEDEWQMQREHRN